MNTVIKLLMIGGLMSGCQVGGNDCDPQELLPYSKSEVIYEPHCSEKCCEFVVHEEPGDSLTETCHEMWCFRDCEWTMNHKACY